LGKEDRRHKVTVNILKGGTCTGPDPQKRLRSGLPDKYFTPRCRLTRSLSVTEWALLGDGLPFIHLARGKCGQAYNPATFCDWRARLPIWIWIWIYNYLTKCQLLGGPSASYWVMTIVRRGVAG